MKGWGILAVVAIAVAGVCASAGCAPKVNPADGAEMVSVPAGEFTMGSDDGQPDERPAHKVHLDGYWIYQNPVTVAQYRRFCVAVKREMPERPWFDWNDSHPIVNVTWHDAAAYAKWAGGNLPTEAQWEKAARGTDGRKYPWGNDWDANKCRCLGKTRGTSAVGSFPAGASPYGCNDMSGNVWEWCRDWYDEAYYAKAPAKNPPGPAQGIFRVRRGGAWNYDGSDYRCAGRNCLNPDYGPYFHPNMGFRVVQPE